MAFKSVLLNELLKWDLFLHILTDQDASQALDDIHRNATWKIVMIMNIEVRLSGYYLHPKWQMNWANRGL